MKKTILLLTTLLLLFYANASEDVTKDTAKYVTDTNAEKLIDKYTEKIEAGISALAESLKQPAEHIYDVLVRQRVIEAWKWICIIGLNLFLTILFAIVLKGFKGSEGDTDALRFIVLIFGIITFIMIIFGLNPILSGFINPEYGAIKEIANFFN